MNSSYLSLLLLLLQKLLQIIGSDQHAFSTLGIYRLKVLCHWAKIRYSSGSYQSIFWHFPFQAYESHHLFLNHGKPTLHWRPLKRCRSSTYFFFCHPTQFSQSGNSIHMAVSRISLSSIPQLCTFQVLDCHQHRRLVTGYKLVFNSTICHFFLITLSKLQWFYFTTVPKNVLENWCRASVPAFMLYFHTV